MIRTSLGQVGLRRPREQQAITLADGWYGKDINNTVVVRAGWLKEQRSGTQTLSVDGELEAAEAAARRSGDGEQRRALEEALFRKAEEHKEYYRRHVGQAIQIAATDMKILDLEGSMDPQTGLERTGEQKKQALESLQQLRAGWVSGEKRFRSNTDAQGVVLQTKKVARSVLVKRGGQTGQLVKRYFKIDSGKLYIYRYQRGQWSGITQKQPPRLYDVSRLTDSDYKIEVLGNPGVESTFFESYKHRVRLSLRERVGGPVYLYAQDFKEAKTWERAIRMSQFLQRPGDAEALRYVVQRLAGTAPAKAWGALALYAKEMKTLREDMRRLSMRLIRSDLARAWVKARMVFKQRREAEIRKAQQLEHAKQLMLERAVSITSKSMRPPQVIRRASIDKIGKAFRLYRQERIMDRAYPLGAFGKVLTRMERAMTGARMGAAFSALTSEQVLRLVFHGSGQELDDKVEQLKSANSPYSPVAVPVRQTSVHVSESFSILYFTEVDEHSELSHLAKGGWAHFVNLDQISSVVLHAERMLKQDSRQRLELHPGMCSGAWFTIHGPRVCWGRQLRERPEAKGRDKSREEVVGGDDGLKLGRELASGKRLRWLSLSVRVLGAFLPEMEEAAAPSACDGEDKPAEEASRTPADVVLFDDDLEGSPGSQQSIRTPGAQAKQTFLVLHVLGRRFESERLPGRSPRYFRGEEGPIPCEVKVPVPDEGNLAVLDNCNISVDIVRWAEDPTAVMGTRQRDRGRSRTIWTGKLPLWKLFAAERHIGLPTVGAAEVVSLVRSLSDTLASKESGVKKVQLVQPWTDGREQFSGASLELEAVATFDEAVEPSAVPLSPELQGRGSSTALYSSHRGAWFDPALGPAALQTKQAASFLELGLKEFKFPEGDKDDKFFRYHIEAKCNGVAVRSIALHRPKAIWRRVIFSDPGRIDYAGTKIFVPLPPGAWLSGKSPSVELAVMRVAPPDLPTVALWDLLPKPEATAPAPPQPELAYHCALQLDGMAIDETVEAASVPLYAPEAVLVEVGLRSNRYKGRDGAAVIGLSATMRDRDFVRLNAEPQFGQEAVLCVGEVALLQVEEVLQFPSTELEFRRRGFAGTFKDAERRNPGSAVPLREPCMSHEYTASGFESLDQELRPAFKQRHVPGSSPDLIPYQYVLPKSELDFMREGRPGVFRRVVERLVGEAIKAKRDVAQGTMPPPLIVTELTHLLRNVLVTVLAVYANSTCDVEVTPSFMHQWERFPERRYGLPGALLICSFKDNSDVAVMASPPGTGDVGQVSVSRYILQGVPLSSVTSVQAASFNVYDAAFGSVADAAATHPLDSSNGFNPRLPGCMEAHDYEKERRGGYVLRAGPLPPDAGPMCQYEWSLHLHAPSESDACHFVTMLRQSLRLDLAQQIRKLQEYKAKSARAAPPYDLGPVLSQESGHLEVVLVEARHLLPQVVQPEPDPTARVAWLPGGPPQPNVTFVLKDKVAEFEQDMVYRGTTVQLAPKLVGGNPNWSKLPELESSGGWVFRSPIIDSGRFPCLGFELNVMNNGQCLGQARVPITCGSREAVEFQLDGDEAPRRAYIVERRPDLAPGRGGQKLRYFEPRAPGLPETEWVRIVKNHGDGYLIYEPEGSRVEVACEEWEERFDASAGVPQADLCDARARFHNLWLPLSSPGDGTVHTNGEVHVLTLWVPLKESQKDRQDEKDQKSRRLPKTARAWRLQAIRSKLQTLDLREPNYELEVRKRGYNPNNFRDGERVHRSEFLARHVEDTEDTRPYLDCIERQGHVLWWSFLEALQPFRTGREASMLRSIGEIRELLSRPPAPNRALSYRLTDALRRGVPPAWRRHVWLEVLGADRLQESYHGGIGFDANRAAVVARYKELVKYGRVQLTDPMLQLHEDLVGAAGWESGLNPKLVDRHQALLSRAEEVCIALIAFCQDVPRDKGPPGVLNFHPPSAKPRRQVAYSESILVLAFFLLLAQGVAKDSGEYMAFIQGLDGEPPGSQDDEEEVDNARAFWMLYALTTGLAYQEYYAAPVASAFVIPEVRMEDGGPMCDRHGAMEDLNRLRFCLARNEIALWVHLEALGFQLATVFYGAFMRLFAFLLPCATLFRFWDMLFSDATDPAWTSSEAQRRRRPPRRGLIDVSFGALRACKPQLLKCESGLEARDCLVHFLESRYDPAELIEMATASERLLWGDLMMAPQLHSADYEAVSPMWEEYLLRFRMQNHWLKKLVQETEVSSDGSRDAMTEGFDMRVTTKNLVNLVIPALKRGLMLEAGTTAGILHPVPKGVLQAFGPPAPKGLATIVTGWATWAYQQIMPVPIQQQLPVAIPAPPDTAGEPFYVEKVHWQTTIEAAMGLAWSVQCGELYQYFQVLANPGMDRRTRISLWEFFCALICSSKGTAGEKALALFNIYASVQPTSRVHHITPVTHAANTIIERIEGNQQSLTGDPYKPPSPEEDRSMALKFRIFIRGQTSGSGSDDLFGEAFVTSLQPFITTSMSSAEPRIFTIWGVPERLPPGEHFGPRGASTVRSIIGWITLTIRWMPVDEQNLEVGQLGLTLHSIRFEARYVEAMETKNPRVSVVTFDQEGEEVHIPRWDPRSNRGSMYFTTAASELLLADTFGEFIDFPTTMWRDLFGKLKHNWIGNHHGWVEEEELWAWDPRAGEQYSDQRFCMRSEHVRRLDSDQPNVISIAACRILTEAILQRSLHCVTNRQAMLIADQAFNRAGAVPGILEAMLITDGQDGKTVDDFKHISMLIQEAHKRGISCVDVRQQLVAAHEACMSARPGNINLFSASYALAAPQPLWCGAPPTYASEGKLSLGGLGIVDPSPGRKKVLWIRYARAGDGERFNSKYRVDEEGCFPAEELVLDMDVSTVAGKIQMSLTKEEFVSGILGSSLLSESLRRMTTFDNSAKEVPQARALKLSVVIADPMSEEADEDFMDIADVRQRIVFEVYDHDRTSLSDYLGECALPSLGSLSPVPRTFLLPITGPTDSSREAFHKDKETALQEGEQRYKGNLWVEASWTLPAEEEVPQEAADSIEGRAERERLSHTGKLVLTIQKASGLRAADTRGTSDPFVSVYRRNETILESQKSGFPRGLGERGWTLKEVFRTSVKSKTLDPVWQESFTLFLQTGAFERRTASQQHWALTRAQQQQSRQESLVASLAEQNELDLTFDDEDRLGTGPPGSRHDVKVYLGEFIYQFKNRMREACRDEMRMEDQAIARLQGEELTQARHRKAQFEALAKGISAQHVVMVFVPSKTLREMYNAGQRSGSPAYDRQYRVEYPDPASWQPLDPIRTFNHYASMYGFATRGPHHIRVVEGTENYKFRNSRYRMFMETQERWQKRVEDVNSSSECFGYAKYVHKRDGGSTEWRPVIAERAHDTDGPRGGKRRFRVSFLHTPLGLVGEQVGGPQATPRVEVYEDALLLGPPSAKILGSTNRAHIEFLRQAKDLELKGLNEAGIVQRLNELMVEQWQATVDSQEGAENPVDIPPPTPLTLHDVQHALRG